MKTMTDWCMTCKGYVDEGHAARTRHPNGRDDLFWCRECQDYVGPDHNVRDGLAELHHVGPTNGHNVRYDVPEDDPLGHCAVCGTSFKDLEEKELHDKMSTGTEEVPLPKYAYTSDAWTGPCPAPPSLSDVKITKVHGGDVSYDTRQTGSARFHELLREIGELHDQKQRDYGRPGDPFANIRSSSEFGVRPWVGALVRANDKMKRLQKATRGGQMANEYVEDSFKDLAVYALIGLCLYEEDQQNPSR